MNLARLIEAHPAGGRALYDRGRWHSWGEVRERAAAAAAGLGSLGLVPGDRVAIAWPTSVDFVVAYLGVLAAGLVAVPLNPNSPPAELARELAVVSPAALLAGGAAALCAAEVSAALSPSPVLVLPAGSPAPTSDAAASDAAAGGAGPAAGPSWEEFSAAGSVSAAAGSVEGG
ncbi:MAG TPA: AMP-binding protein, partial [Acidimicrobiales bacterium]|nr:AMP-binding protein [Acidimicrobiales bacterium]